MTPLLLGLAMAVGAPALKDKPAPEPTLVGEWTAESVSVGGQPSTAGPNYWVFRADRTWAIRAQGADLDSGTYTGDARGSLGTADLVGTRGAPRTNLCRYRIDGDTLILSVGHDPTVRPNNLDPGEKTTVWVFKRVGKKD